MLPSGAEGVASEVSCTPAVFCRSFNRACSNGVETAPPLCLDPTEVTQDSSCRNVLTWLPPLLPVPARIRSPAAQPGDYEVG